MALWPKLGINRMHLEKTSLQLRHNKRSGVSNHRLAIVYLTVYSYADQRKHQIFASLAFVRGLHRSPVNSPHKGPVTRKMLPFDDVIMMKKSMTCTGSYFPVVKASSHDSVFPRPSWVSFGLSGIGNLGKIDRVNTRLHYIMLTYIFHLL